jgi:hypothetical protein
MPVTTEHSVQIHPIVMETIQSLIAFRDCVWTSQEHKMTEALISYYFPSSVGKDLSAMAYEDALVMRTPAGSQQAEFFALVADDDTQSTWKCVHVKHNCKHDALYDNRLIFKSHIWHMTH